MNMKNALIILCICCSQALAQNPGTNRGTTEQENNKTHVPGTSQLSKEPGAALRNQVPPAPSSVITIVGSTTYDLQTNYSSCHRIYELNGQIGLSFTTSNTFTSLFPDRGTAYNYNDGTNWLGGLPSSQMDTLAWSNIDLGANNTEYMVGHNRYTTTDYLVLLQRTPAGTGAWTKSVLPPHPQGIVCQWPKMRVGGASGNSIHVISMTYPDIGVTWNGMKGVMTYSRSQDGGATWDQVHVLLPGIDSVHYKSMKPDSYSIDARDNVVAITQGSYYNDWILWKSTDNGDTWVRTVIQAFPTAAYDELTMDTDFDSDGIADTADHVDGSQAVLIDNSDMVHCFIGRMLVTEELGSTSLTYFGKTNGLLYWNESVGANGPAVIAGAEDLDGSGAVEILNDVAPYGVSMASMPTVAMDGGTNIFLAYSAVMEWTSNGNPDPAEEQPFRNMYCMYSPDNGYSWSTPINLEPSFFDEMVYPSMARNVDSLLHIVWQMDGEPGGNLTDGDPISSNDIMYYSVDPDSLFAGVNVIPFNYHKMKGEVFFDQNQNGIKDPGDYGMSGLTLTETPGGLSAYTQANGRYIFVADTGWHTVNLNYGPNWMVTTDSTSYTVYLNSLVIDTLDFGLYPVNSVYDVETILTGGLPRCNFQIHFYVHYTNTGTEPTSGTVKMILDPQLTLTNTIPPYTSLVGDTIEWTFTNLLPYQQGMVHIISGSMGLNFGDTTYNCAEVWYNNGAGTSISTDCLQQAIVCSYDPNDKSVQPDGMYGQHYSLIADTLVYTIRFQNTGNDTAFVVRIRDTLDTWLNPATFQLKAASHTVDVTHNPPGILLFTFNNILLPDSATDEPGSNGFVKFSVQPYPNTPIGTEVYNTAYIFFDYNPPIVTNTTLNTLVDVVGMEDLSESEYGLTVYPNPAAGNATLLIQQELSQGCTLRIMDATGRQVLKDIAIVGQTIHLPVSVLSKGIYLCVLHDASGQIIGQTRFVVMKKE